MALDPEALMKLYARATRGPWKACPMKMYVNGGDGMMVLQIRGFGAEKGTQDINCDLVEAMHAAVPELVRELKDAHFDIEVLKSGVNALKEECANNDHLEYQLKQTRDELVALEADAKRLKAAVQAWVDRDVAREQLLHSLKETP